MAIPQSNARPVSKTWSPHKGVTLSQIKSNALLFSLSEPVGQGSMRIVSLCPWLYASTVSFKCNTCPNLPANNHLASNEGTWFTINLCLEGRCEVTIPGRGCAIVGAGDCCISCTDDTPQRFSYPMGAYEGVELFVNTKLVDRDPAFTLCNQTHRILDDIAHQAGFASVFAGDSELNEHLARIGRLVELIWDFTEDRHTESVVSDGGHAERGPASGKRMVGKRAADKHAENSPVASDERTDGRHTNHRTLLESSLELHEAQCKYEALGLFLKLAQRDIASAKPRALLTPRQIEIARSVRETIEKSPHEPNDVRKLAPRYGVSATTLNRYFETLYGTTVSAYVRHRRMQKSCELLGLGMRVADVSITVGYSNPSKFAAAFKRETGMTPTEYRLMKKRS